MLFKSRRTVRQLGFTLIELLVAISILGIVAVLGWRGLDAIVRARETLNEEMLQTRGVQLAFAQIENDCAHLMDPTMLSGQSVLTAAGSKLMLIRSFFDETQPVLFQVVVYNVIDGVLARRELTPTRERSVLLAEWQSAAQDTDGTPVIPLQKSTKAFTFRTWKQGETGWRMNGDDTLNTSDTSGQAVNNPTALSQKTPTLAGLEVSMQIQGREGLMTKIFLLGAN